MRMNKEKILKLIYNLCKYIIGTVDDIDFIISLSIYEAIHEVPSCTLLLTFI